MVIEQSGVQFGLKSYVWFQRASSIWNHKYDFTEIAGPEVQSPLLSTKNYIYFEIGQFNSLNKRTTRFWSVPLYIETVAGLSKSEARNAFTSDFENMSTSCQRDVIASCDWLFFFTVLFSLAEKKMRLRAKKIVRFVNKSHRWEQGFPVFI